MSLRPPQVIPELLERLQVAPAFEGALVRWGLLAQLPRERDRIYLLGTIDYGLAPTTQGHRLRTEDYAVRGLVECHLLGVDGPEQAVERAWGYLAAIDAELNEDPDFVAGGHYTGRLSVQADEVVPMPDGWLARAVFRLGMEAYR